MKKKSKSLIISWIMTKVTIVALLCILFLIPDFAQWYDKFSGAAPIYTVLCVCLYISMLPAFILLFSLDRILSNIKNGSLFTMGNVVCLRIISCCCFLIGVIYGVLSFWRMLSLLVCFIAFFVGVIIFVLQSVFRQAVLIREENDFTV